MAMETGGTFSNKSGKNVRTSKIYVLRQSQEVEHAGAGGVLIRFFNFSAIKFFYKNKSFIAEKAFESKIFDFMLSAR